jgi:2-polyprenyl-3-methyl-5-hydroxy-6-metoxy-1,4-benzoquinol methylase
MQLDKTSMGAFQGKNIQDAYTREEVVCNICGIQDEEFLFYTPERIVRCRRCGLIYNNPRLTFESLQKIYTREYFVVESNDPGIDYKAYSNYIEEEPLIIRSMHRRLKKIESLVNEKGRLLDVGCATGFSLIAAQQRGWEAEGVELSSFCVDYAHSRGLKVYQGTIKNSPGEQESFTAITMWDYLEHSTDPVGDLTACHGLLKRGGVIVLSTPNVDSWSFHLFKKNWIGFKNIDHLYYYSRKTLSTIAGMAGLSMEHSFYQGRDVALSFFLARLQYYIKFKPLLRLIERIANRSVIKNISFYMNPYDILNVVLRK